MKRREFIASVAAAAMPLRANANAQPQQVLAIVKGPNPAWVVYDICLHSGFAPDELDLASFQQAAKVFESGGIETCLQLLAPRMILESIRECGVGLRMADGTLHITAPVPASR